MSMKDIKDLTEHALNNKILKIESGSIKIEFCPSVFNEKLNVPEIKEDLTEEEKLEKQKKQLEEDLFHSV